MTRNQRKVSRFNLQEFFGADKESLKELLREVLQEVLEQEMTDALGPESWTARLSSRYPNMELLKEHKKLRLGLAA